MRTTITAIVLGLAAILPLGQAVAQSPPVPGSADTVPEQMRAEPKPPPAPRESADPLEEKDLRQLVETVKMVRLSQQLGLNDEQTVIMMRMYDRYREHNAQLKREQQQLLRQLKEVTKAGKPDAEIEAALQKLLEQDRKIADSRNKALEYAGKDLNATQRAKLYVFLSEFEEDMRRLIQRARQASPERLMRMRELRDNSLDRPEGPRGPGDRPGMPPPRPRRGPDDPIPAPPPGESPPPPPRENPPIPARP
ncbi:MAG: hypothetical protein RBU21_01800 [FCB group bacterium]|jgi:hypothetical protein|nr:hypothetical protein [FCB group bacterium]